MPAIAFLSVGIADQLLDWEGLGFIIWVLIFDSGLIQQDSVTL